MAVSDSQIARINVFAYMHTENQFEVNGVLNHRWEMMDLKTWPLALFKQFVESVDTFCSNNEITNYLLNYGPLFEAEAEKDHIILEKYVDDIANEYTNTLYTSNFDPEVAVAHGAPGVHGFGFVLWDDAENDPPNTITYNPEFFDPREGVPLIEVVVPPNNAENEVPVENAQQNGGGGRRSRTTKKHRNVRKRRHSRRHR